MGYEYDPLPCDVHFPAAHYWMESSQRQTEVKTRFHSKVAEVGWEGCRMKSDPRLGLARQLMVSMVLLKVFDQQDDVETHLYH